MVAGASFDKASAEREICDKIAKQFSGVCLTLAGLEGQSREEFMIALRITTINALLARGRFRNNAAIIRAAQKIIEACEWRGREIAGSQVGRA